MASANLFFYYNLFSLRQCDMFRSDFEMAKISLIKLLIVQKNWKLHLNLWNKHRIDFEWLKVSFVKPILTNWRSLQTWTYKSKMNGFENHIITGLTLKRLQSWRMGNFSKLKKNLLLFGVKSILYLESRQQLRRNKIQSSTWLQKQNTSPTNLCGNKCYSFGVIQPQTTSKTLLC